MSTKNPRLADHRSTSATKQQEVQENPFSNNVLIGNWYEERFGDKNDKEAIAPGICGHSDCLKEKSHYKRDFTQPVASDSQNDFHDFIRWKQMGFRNRLNGEMTNIRLWDSDQFEKNLTTTKDIMYNILPKEREKRGEFNILKKFPKEDLMRSYGNNSITGLLQWRNCEERKQRNTPADMSHYKTAFKRLPLDPKRRVCKGPQRKTSII